MRISARLARLEATITTREKTILAADCICFPENEHPEFRWKAEVDLAVQVLCPLHGKRFSLPRGESLGNIRKVTIEISREDGLIRHRSIKRPCAQVSIRHNGLQSGSSFLGLKNPGNLF
jgi:nitrite reductase/ring-hydroxylating ferredoxin subunit